MIAKRVHVGAFVAFFRQDVGSARGREDYSFRIRRFTDLGEPILLFEMWSAPIHVSSLHGGKFQAGQTLDPNWSAHDVVDTPPDKSVSGTMYSVLDGIRHPPASERIVRVSTIDVG